MAGALRVVLSFDRLSFSKHRVRGSILHRGRTMHVLHFWGTQAVKCRRKKKNISTSPPTSVFYIYINVNCTHPFEIKMWNTKSLGRGAKVVGTLRPFCKLIRVLWDDAPAYEEAFPHQRERGPKRGIKLIYSEAEQGLQTIIQTLLINCHNCILLCVNGITNRFWMGWSWLKIQGRNKHFFCICIF